MATVNGLTAERMLEIEGNSIVDGNLVGDDLVLVKHDGTTKNVGNVRGPQGFPGVSDMNTYSPIGVPQPLILPTIPTGWGLCDAIGEHDALAYPVLAAAFGTGPACVNGPAAVGYFKLPDLRGKTFFGRHPGIPAFDTLGEVGGTKDAVVVNHDHTASSDQPAHSHTADQAAHDHSGTTTTNGAHWHTANLANVLSSANTSHAHQSNTGTVSEGHTSGALADPAPVNVDTTGDHYHGINSADPAISVDPADPGISTTVNANGVSGTDANLPPYRVVNWIMRLA